MAPSLANFSCSRSNSPNEQVKIEKLVIMCISSANPVVRNFGRRCLGQYSAPPNAGCLLTGSV